MADYMRKEAKRATERLGYREGVQDGRQGRKIKPNAPIGYALGYEDGEAMRLGRPVTGLVGLGHPQRED